MLKNLISVALALLLLAAFGSSAAPIVNGRFETGTFNGWSGGGNTSLGYSAVVDSSAGGPMIQGQYSALLVSIGPGNNCDFDPWGCPPIIPIPFPSTPPPGPPLANPYPDDLQIYDAGLHPLRQEEKSELGQDFEARAGDHLTLDWRWVTNDSPFPDPSHPADDVIFLIVSGETFVATAAERLGSCGPAPPITGFHQPPLTGCPVDLMVPFDGIWSLYISVGQVEDGLYSSGVLIDNVRIRNVPEPCGLLLLLIGATGIAWARRRKQ